MQAYWRTVLQILTTIALVFTPLGAHKCKGQFGGGIAEPPGICEQLLEEISRKKYERVAVLPYFVESSPGNEAIVGLDLHSHAQLFATRISDKLAQLAQDKFVVISHDLLVSAFADTNPRDVITDLAKLRSVASRVDGFNALVVGFIERDFGQNAAPNLRLKCHILEVDSRSGGGGRSRSITSSMGLSLGGLAYAGNSFEPRRLSADGELIATSPVDPYLNTDFSAMPFSIFTAMVTQPSQKHPLQDPGCPFNMKVLVDGVERPIHWIHKQPWVGLEVGDKVSIRLSKGIPQRVCMAVFVDGVNVLGSKVEHPGNCKYWIMDTPRSEIKGYYELVGNQLAGKVLQVAAGGEGRATQLGSRDKVGQITVIFYTIGTPERIVQAPRNLSTKQAADSIQWPSGRFAQRWLGRYPRGQAGSAGPQAAGEGPGADVEFVDGSQPIQSSTTTLYRGENPGLILCAITVRYTTTLRLNEAIAAGSDQ